MADREEEIDTFDDKLETRLEAIGTRDDLVEFVRMLHFGVNNEMFEDQGLSDYISGIYGVINGLNALEKNTGMPNPDPPDWQLVGRVLLYAFYHS